MWNIKDSMKWDMANVIGYKPITTFWQDFSIAETFGQEAIRETAERCFKEWKNDYKYLTELIMVINHKSWYWNNKNERLMELYSKLYYKYDDKAIKALNNNKTALNYYFKTLD